MDFVAARSAICVGKSRWFGFFKDNDNRKRSYVKKKRNDVANVRWGRQKETVQHKDPQKEKKEKKGEMKEGEVNATERTTKKFRNSEKR